MNFESKIGIIGLGFVGGAIKNSLPFVETVVVDVDNEKNTGTYDELMKCAGIFVCVPSPRGERGFCDSRILESVLLKLKDYTGVIISKTTATPDVYEHLGKTYKNLVHSPEFLTAANANRDYMNGTFCIIGGSVEAYIREAERLIKTTQPFLQEVHYCTLGEAALTKYSINSFLATKVTFMNELWGIAVASGLDYDRIIEMINADNRIGPTHMAVPGPDGSFGFGGMCFPKDTEALLKYAESINCQMNVLDAAVKKNTILRLTEPK